MNKNLEFDKILEQLTGLAVSEAAKERLLKLEPFLNENACISAMQETTEAKIIMEGYGSPPVSEMKDTEKILILCEKGSMLVPEQLTGISRFIMVCGRMKAYLKRAEALGTSAAYYGESLYVLEVLSDEIENAIRNGEVDDHASPMLRDVRRKIENINASIKTKLESMLRSKKECFTDSYVVSRGGRLVLPVKKEYRNQIPGTVIDISGTGGTYFIEPEQARKLTDELTTLHIQEENEVRRILFELTSLVFESIKELRINIECMTTLDFIFAKAKLSINMNGIPAVFNNSAYDRKIKIIQGRHPLLKKEACIPLDFSIGSGIRGVIITGPNTGGKTVALKTVGLLSLMAQSGLHVPAAEGSEFCMQANILCDIGDGQSITENLSTFSSHMTNIIQILRSVTDESLVLLDELGSGTDPAEGMGLAVSILEELKRIGCLFIATTHYPEIKDYAKNTEGIINARMGFDKESLKPLYKLQIGEAGESCALSIAQKLGFPAHMLRRAYKEAYGIEADFYGEENGHIYEERQKIQRTGAEKPKSTASDKFVLGDSVRVYPQKAVGIVFKRANEKGMVGVQIKGKKQYVNHKRLKLLASASELYPDDYDLSIVFDTVENRKARHEMERKHTDLTITIENEF